MDMDMDMDMDMGVGVDRLHSLHSHPRPVCHARPVVHLVRYLLRYFVLLVRFVCWFAGDRIGSSRSAPRRRMPEVGDKVQVRRTSWTRWYAGTVTKVTKKSSQLDVTLQLAKIVLCDLTPREWLREGESTVDASQGTAGVTAGEAGEEPSADGRPVSPLPMGEHTDAGGGDGNNASGAPSDPLADHRSPGAELREEEDAARREDDNLDAASPVSGMIDQSLVYFPIAYSSTKKVVARQRKNAQQRAMKLGKSRTRGAGANGQGAAGSGVGSGVGSGSADADQGGDGQRHHAHYGANQIHVDRDARQHLFEVVSSVGILCSGEGREREWCETGRGTGGRVGFRSALCSIVLTRRHDTTRSHSTTRHDTTRHEPVRPSETDITAIETT